MTIKGLGTQSMLQVERLVSMRRQLDDLQRQLGTQKRSDNYAGIGLDRGLTVGLRSNLSAVGAYGDSITKITSRIDLAQLALTDLDGAARTIKNAAPKSQFVLSQGGRTQDQITAQGQLDRMLGALNTQFGDQYIFSGLSPDQPAVRNTNEILNGVGTQAGLIKLIGERNQADIGASGLGRLVIPATTSTTAGLTGSGASLSPDVLAATTGGNDLTAYTAGANGTLEINGVAVAVQAGDDATTIRDAINTAMTAAPPGTPKVGATIDGGGRLVLTGADASVSVDVGAGSSPALLTDLGLAVGTASPSNLITQGAVTPGQTLSVSIGTSSVSVTFGTGAGQIASIGQLNAALAGLTGGTATVDPANGNLTVTASSSTGAITVGGTVAPATFGLAGTSSTPTNVVSIGEDVAGSVFGFKLNAIATTVSGATPTQPAGSPPQMSIDLGATLPKDGDTVTFSFDLPDGTTEHMVLTAVTTAKSLEGAGGFTGPSNTLGFTPGAITVQAPGLNGGTAITVDGLVPNDTASSAASKINNALSAAPAGNGGIVATVVSGQVVLTARNGDVVTMGGDSATLDGLGFAAGNRTGTIVAPATEKGTFAIGTTQGETLANLHTALGDNVRTLAQTSLSAASAVQASNEFFNADAAHPVQRVDGPPFDSATALRNATATDTLSWYTGEAGSTSARSTAAAKIDTQISVSYGLRANEQAFRIPLANVAAMAAMQFDPADTNGQGRYAALMERMQSNLGDQQGVQKIKDVTSDLANAQTAIASTKQRHTQTKATLTGLLESIEGVPMEETAATILALQTSLTASLQTTALLSKLNLVNYL